MWAVLQRQCVWEAGRKEVRPSTRPVPQRDRMVEKMDGGLDKRAYGSMEIHLKLKKAASERANLLLEIDTCSPVHMEAPVW